jgi:alkaline phosphatase D
MINLAGAWTTNFGKLTLTQDGDQITGEYEHDGGTLRATLSGRVLTGTWSEIGKRGPVSITIEEGGNSFHGTWRYEGAASGGSWFGLRLALPEQGEGATPAPPNALREGPLLAGPMLGEAGTTEARVWAQARDESPLTLRVRGADGSEIRVDAEPAWSEWLCVTFVVTGLSPATRYEYEIESRHGTTGTSHLHTMPDALSRRLKIAFGSCFLHFDAPQPIFDSIGREDPDVFMMIGDNTYYDAYVPPFWGTEHTMMLGQLRSRNNDALRRLGARVPVLAIWDDHDFGYNDVDGRFVNRDASLAVFQRVWAQASYGAAGQPGIFSSVRAGPVEILLLDGRYERIEKERILGEAQMAWLKERLRASDAPVKLVVSGSQVLAEVAASKDWECFERDGKRELEELCAFIEAEDVRGVVFASGDVHLGYLLQRAARARADGRIGPDFWEITSSPLANAIWTERLVAAGERVDRHVVAEIPSVNYGVVDVDLDRPGAEIAIALRDAAGQTLAARSIALARLAVRAPGRRIFAAIKRPDGALDLLREDGVERTGVGRVGSIEALYPGLRPGGADGAVVWPDGKAYFFEGGTYLRYDLARGAVDAGYPQYIAPFWRGLPPSGIDAGVVWNNGKAYFFRGREYYRYDLAADSADPSYPRPIERYFRGLFPDGVDAAVVWDERKAYFFRGEEVLRYDMVSDRADPGYPRPIAEEWPGTSIA